MEDEEEEEVFFYEKKKRKRESFQFEGTCRKIFYDFWCVTQRHAGAVPAGPAHAALTAPAAALATVTIATAEIKELWAAEVEVSQPDNRSRSALKRGGSRFLESYWGNTHRMDVKPALIGPFESC